MAKEKNVKNAKNVKAGKTAKTVKAVKTTKTASKSTKSKVQAKGQAKKPTSKTVSKVVASVSASKNVEKNINGKGFVFFNCNEEKSHDSMNIFYNNAIYRNVRASRRLLWQKIKDEMSIGRIQIAKDSIPVVRKAILEGDPTKATSQMKYGAIMEFQMFE